MAVSVETAKREMSAALIDAFKLRAEPFLIKVESCRTMLELRQVIFVIIDNASASEPQKTKILLSAWQSLEQA